MEKDNYVYLSDYKEYPFLIPEIRLHFIIHKKHVRVTNNMFVQKINPNAEKLELKGKNIQLHYIEINGYKLKEHDYKLYEDELVINIPKDDKFQVKIVGDINPYNNESLEGLYSSEGMLVTQCEAEGFRRITFHPDRPDILSKYQVSIEVDPRSYKTVLSNGNLIRTEEDIETKRKTYLWIDPFNKPCYLFALAVGNLTEIQETYTSIKGKDITIRMHVEPGNESYCIHAINSLKKAMKWDEEKFDLEYDLDQYNIVSVRHFNMGAMENKSLNIFNSKLVLADKSIATDKELERIESVIAHEYFHNWTGNRVTCRDWFQLSLKEGLTVFRDQYFTSEIHSKDVKRIEDAITLRTRQFTEDASPTSHPVKPTKYKSIDNFYTTTIYEKGAEIIRMIKTIVGEENFIDSIKCFIEKYDGRAVTTEDFLDSFPLAESKKTQGYSLDVEQFKRWYYDAGTPKVRISQEWDKTSKSLKITFSQVTIQNKIEKKNPNIIPILYSIFNSKGDRTKEKLFILREAKETLILNEDNFIKEDSYLSVFRNLSSPVNWDYKISEIQLLSILKNDDNIFSKWESSQQLMKRIILDYNKPTKVISLEDEYIKTISMLLSNEKKLDLRGIYYCIKLPETSELELLQSEINPINIYNSTIQFETNMGKTLSSSLYKLLNQFQPKLHEEWPAGQGERLLTEIAWRWLSLSGDITIRKEVIKYILGGSMTLSRAALNSLKDIPCEERDEALNIFFDRWKNRPEVLDSWFMIKASMPSLNRLDTIQELVQHPLYDPIAPNAIRAVLVGLANNPTTFHNHDGSGYNFMANQIIQVDSSNPITASRLIKVFKNWNNLIPTLKEKMFEAICSISKENLSRNTKEVLDLIIQPSHI